MGHICFKIDGYPVFVSTHGYFEVYAKAPVPPLDSASWPCGGIYMGSVSELDPGLSYSPEVDDVYFETVTGEVYSWLEALERPELKAAVKRWLEVHVREIADLDRRAQADWQYLARNRPLDGIALGERCWLVCKYNPYSRKRVRLLWYEREDWRSHSTEQCLFETDCMKFLLKKRRLHSTEQHSQLGGTTIYFECEDGSITSRSKDRYILEPECKNQDASDER